MDDSFRAPGTTANAEGFQQSLINVSRTATSKARDTKEAIIDISYTASYAVHFDT